MAAGTQEIVTLHAPGNPPPRPVRDVVERARDTGQPLPSLWDRHVVGAMRTACAHGERHSLWWEFALVHSLEAAQQSWDLAPSLFRWRLRHLTAELHLRHLLDVRVLDLSPSERARADLAAALLSRPEALLWEEPFVAMPPEDRLLTARLVRSLVRGEGLTVVAVAAEPPGLSDLGAMLPPPAAAAHGMHMKEAATL
ncbi:MAG: hypothetical protein ACM3ZA_06825 [Bacillota bacterium]